MTKNNDYPQEVPPQKDLLGGPFWGGTSWVHQSSESPTSIIMFYLYFHSLIWALGVIGHVYQGPNGDFCGRNRWDNKSWKFPKTHLKPENTFVMLNVVAVMFLNLTLSSFLHKCRSTASTQVHLQVGLIQQVILQVSHLQWNIVNLFLISSRQSHCSLACYKKYSTRGTAKST